MAYTSPLLWIKVKGWFFIETKIFQARERLWALPHTHTHNHSIAWKIWVSIKNHPLTLIHNRGPVYAITCFTGKYTEWKYIYYCLQYFVLQKKRDRDFEVSVNLLLNLLALKNNEGHPLFQEENNMRCNTLKCLNFLYFYKKYPVFTLNVKPPK